MAPGPIDRERVARRLEAGDWVVATGEAARVSHGLGKLSDGDYDPADDLRTLQELWFEKLSPFDERGYNARPKAPPSG